MVYLYGRPHSPSNVACHLPSGIVSTLQSICLQASGYIIFLRAAGVSPFLGGGLYIPQSPVHAPATAGGAAVVFFSDGSPFLVSWARVRPMPTTPASSTARAAVFMLLSFMVKISFNPE